jgi:hypothetical protein
MNQKNSKSTTIWAMGACWIFLAAATLPNARAQNPPAPGGRFGRARFVGAEAFLGGKVVAGAPYSAQAVTEHTQTLPDGNAIHTTTTANVYRDSQGRTRREQEIGAIGPWAAQGTPRKVISISDPVAGFIHILNPDTQKEVNPQFGETTFQLTNIVRAEPDASLFQVPPNYTISEVTIRSKEREAKLRKFTDLIVTNRLVLRNYTLCLGSVYI